MGHPKLIYDDSALSSVARRNETRTSLASASLLIISRNLSSSANTTFTRAILSRMKSGTGRSAWPRRCSALVTVAYSPPNFPLKLGLEQSFSVNPTPRDGSIINHSIAADRTPRLWCSAQRSQSSRVAPAFRSGMG